MSLFLACSPATSRRLTMDTPKSPQIAKKIEKDSFPVTWVGYWTGVLDIFSAKGKMQTVPMDVEIAKIDTSANRYIFALIYGEDKVAGRRAYETIIKDPAKGLYINDEKNTIMMEEYLIAGKLYCWFEVQGTLLLSTFERRDEQLLFEIVSGSIAPVSITGNQKHEGEDIPAVKTFPIKSIQRATLTRKK